MDTGINRKIPPVVGHDRGIRNFIYYDNFAFVFDGRIYNDLLDRIHVLKNAVFKKKIVVMDIISRA